MTLQLMPHQIEGVGFLRGHPRALLADEMGLGKTAQAIVAAKVLKGQVLVICPNSLQYNWGAEIDLWDPGATWHVCEGSVADKLHQLHTRMDRYLIVNYAAVQRMQRGLKRTFATLIVDEAHRIKNRLRQSKSGRVSTSGAVQLLGRRAANIYLLTGTPIANRPDDLWSLLNILDPKAFRSYWRFCEEYCKVYHNGYGWIVGGLRNEQGLQEVLKPYMMRRLKSEVLDLPEKLVRRVWVELEPGDRKAYEQMRKHYLAELTTRTVSAPTALAMVTRLKQILVSRGLLESALTPLSGAKADAVLDIIEDDGQVVVFSQFSTAINALSLRLQREKIEHVVMTGDTPLERREEAIRAFKGGTQVLLATIGVGGVGLNLTCANTAVFLDLPWSPALVEQAQDRLHRIGQQNTVTIVELLARNTIDQYILRLLNEKQDDIVASLAGLLQEGG